MTGVPGPIERSSKALQAKQRRGITVLAASLGLCHRWARRAFWAVSGGLGHCGGSRAERTAKLGGSC